MPEIIGIGAALFDMLMTAAHLPKEDTKLQSDGARAQCGGPCATALVAAAKLGIGVGYIGTLGDDLYGGYIRRQMAGYGVEMAHARTVTGANSAHSFVLLNTASATRTCVWNKGDVPAPVPEDVTLEALRGAKMLHLDGHHLEAAVYAAKLAHRHGMQVSLDAGAPYPGLERLLPEVDILIPSEECALVLTGSETAEAAAAELARRWDPRVLLVTQGHRGGFIWTETGPVRYPVYAAEAIDTNGAGDTFHGAFLAGSARGMGLEEAADFASAVSALKCTRFGAQEGIPGFEEACAFQRTHRKEYL